jgi:methyl-accepting chemotaxis protein
MSRIKTSTQLHIFISILTVLIMLSLNMIQENANSFSNSWSNYLNQVASRQIILQDIKTNFGYGGAIHNFKNFLIRNQERYRIRSENQLQDILSSVEYYRAIPGLGNHETKALNDIAKVIGNYQKQIAIIMHMHSEKASIKAIDQIVKVDDKPAIMALRTLQIEFEILTAANSGDMQSEVAKTAQSTIIIFILVALLALSFVLIVNIYIRGKLKN